MLLDMLPDRIYCDILLDTWLNTLFALPPINWTVPITITRITASITAYSAMSCPSSVHHNFLARSVAFIKQPSNADYSEIKPDSPNPRHITKVISGNVSMHRQVWPPCRLSTTVPKSPCQLLRGDECTRLPITPTIVRTTKRFNSLGPTSALVMPKR